MEDILTPKFDDPQALPYGGESGVSRSPRHGAIEHRHMLDFIRTRRAGRAVHSDGFLSLAGMVEPAYVCACGFHGLIMDVKCARCGVSLE